LKGGAAQEYQDKGFSGKNNDRPQFQQLMNDIEAGLIARVVVYKLDRISRSILDFAKMMDMFQKYNVEFISSTEKFDTSTPMGRAMLNICIVFAQLERETIIKRVSDAYHSRTRKGIRMGGKTPYGYKLEPFTIQGIATNKLVADPEATNNVRLEQLIYESMVEKLQAFKSLSGKRGASNNPKLTAAKIELAQVDAEIEKLVDSLTGANAALITFANRKAEELDLKKQALMKQVADLTDSDIPADMLTTISCYLDDWDNASHNDRKQVVNSLVSFVRATNENVEIEWKI